MFTSMDDKRTEWDFHDLAERLNRERNAAQKVVEGRTFSCKFCDRRMIPVLGRRRMWHFRHEPNDDCAYARGDKESETHVFFKHLVKKTILKRSAGAVVSFEKRVQVDNRFRVADVFMQHNNRDYAFEIQVSPIDLDELRQRTMDYDSLGMEIRWVFVGRDVRPDWQLRAEQWLSDNWFDFWHVSVHKNQEQKVIEQFVETPP